MTNGRVDDEEDIRDVETSWDLRRPLRREEGVPAELVVLRDRLRAMPETIRRELEPLVLDAMEQAVFRGRVLGMAREALKRLRAELEDHRQPIPPRTWPVGSLAARSRWGSESRALQAEEELESSFPVAPVIGLDETSSEADTATPSPTVGFESLKRSGRWSESLETMPTPTWALLDLRIDGDVRREAARSST